MKRCVVCNSDCSPFALRCDCGGALAEVEVVHYGGGSADLRGGNARHGAWIGALIGGGGAFLIGFMVTASSTTCDGGNCVGGLMLGLLAAPVAAALGAVVGGSSAGRG